MYLNGLGVTKRAQKCNHFTWRVIPRQQLIKRRPPIVSRPPVTPSLNEQLGHREVVAVTCLKERSLALFIPFIDGSSVVQEQLDDANVNVTLSTPLQARSGMVKCSIAINVLDSNICSVFEQEAGNGDVTDTMV